jgi:hypothetical protein
MQSHNGLTGSSFSVVLLFYLLLLGIVVVVILAGGAGIIAFGNVPAGAEDVSDRCATNAPGA